MPNENNLLEKLYVEVQADTKDYDKQLDSISKDTRKRVQDIEKDFKSLRMDFDDRLAKMKLSEVRTLHKSLVAQMGKKIELGADEHSIEKTAVALDAVKARLKDIKNSSEESGTALVSWFKKIGATLLTIEGIKEIFKFSWDAAKASAELKDLQEGFEGTAKDIELFKKATAGTVDDGDLVKLSNQAADLGIKLKDQPVLFLLAANSAKKYGGDVESGFERLVRASEGASRGLEKVGIQRAVYNQRVKELAAAEGGALQTLDAETQKRIRLQAILDASGLSLKDVETRQASLNEQIKSVPALVHDVKEAFGGLFEPLLKDWLPPAINFLKELGKEIRKLKEGPGPVAAEGVTYDFKGTSPKDREDLISKWTTEAATESADYMSARTKYLKYDMSYDDFKKIKDNTEIALAKYGKLIELAKKYKEETDDGGSGGLDPETARRRSEKLRNQEIDARRKVIEAQAQINEQAITDDYEREKRAIEDKKKLAISAANDKLAKATVDDPISRKAIQDEIKTAELQFQADMLKLKREHGDKLRKQKLEEIKTNAQLEQDRVEGEGQTLAMALIAKRKYLQDSLALVKEGTDEYKELVEEIELLAGRIGKASRQGLKQAAKDRNEAADPLKRGRHERRDKDEELRQWEDDNKFLADTARGSIDSITSEWNNALGTWLVSGKSFAEATTYTWRNMINEIISLIGSLTTKWLFFQALSLIPGFGASSIGGFITKQLGFGHEGGAFGASPRGALKLANGGSMIIPSGYNNDSFGPVMLQSEELMKVYTPSQQMTNMRDYSGILDEMKGMRRAFQIFQMNAIDASFQNQSIDGNINVSGEIRGRDIYLSNQKSSKVQRRIR